MIVGRLHRAFDRAANAIAFAAASVAALILIAMMVLIIVEIVLRNLFLQSTHITEEFVAYGLASLIFLAFAYALKQGALIRVDIVITRLPQKARVALEFVVILVTLAVVVFLAVFIFQTFLRHAGSGAVSWSPAQVPLWAPQLVVFVGVAIFCLQLVAYLLRLIVTGRVVTTDVDLE